MALSVAPIGAFTASAATTSDGLKYSISGDEVEITDYTGSATELEIPAKIEGYPVTSIGYEAFRDCSSLRTITIPNSVKSIGESAFYYCRSLTTITIPDSVTSIGDWAFYRCDRFTTITIPDSVTSIGDSAFRSCSSLTTITIPDSVTSIGNSAFRDCTSLTTVNFNAANCTYMGYYDDYGNYNCTSFGGCSNLTTVNIGENVETIPDFAFYDCTSLTTITIGDSVESIGSYAFYSCDRLTTITIPDSVKSIGENAFSGTAYYNNPNNWKDKVLYVNNHLIKAKDSIETCNVKEGTKTIAGSAFYDCRSLTTITIPDSVTSIGNYVFYLCWDLTTITIPKGVTSIGCSAFDSCYSLTTITIPDSVTSIGDYAFAGCSSLTTITIPDSVKSIGYSAFDSCYSLKTITIPDSVTSIGDYAFDYCSSLTTITLPDSVKSIGDSAFYDCSSLKTIFYGGSEAEKEQMKISFSGNDALLFDAIWHYEATDHSWDSGKITTQPSCAEGVKTFYCTLDGCDGTKNETLKALGHTEVTIPAKVPTYDATGLTAGKKCSVCGKITVAQQTIAKLTKTSLKKAKLTVKAQTYNGKAKKPSVTVKLGNKTLKKNVDYTISYKNNTKIGKATVTVTGKGIYKDSAKTTFAINPKKVSSLKVKAGKKQMTVSFKKDKSAGGYEILYATSKNFKKGKKTIKIKSYKTAKKVIKKLKSKKTYYVKVRSFKKVGGKTYYGAYTTVKKVKVK